MAFAAVTPQCGVAVYALKYHILSREMEIINVKPLNCTYISTMLSLSLII